MDLKMVYSCVNGHVGTEPVTCVCPQSTTHTFPVMKTIPIQGGTLVATEAAPLVIFGANKRLNALKREKWGKVTERGCDIVLESAPHATGLAYVDEGGFFHHNNRGQGERLEVFRIHETDTYYLGYCKEGSPDRVVRRIIVAKKTKKETSNPIVRLMENLAKK